MKPIHLTLPLLCVFLAACGCAKKSPFDVTADQIKSHRFPGGPPDPDHLPPGPEKSEKTFKKGETMPDGSIAKGGEHIIMVHVKGGPDGAGVGGPVTLGQPKMFRTHP